MRDNQPLLSYYPPDDGKFIDHMYVPYLRYNYPMEGKAFKQPDENFRENYPPPPLSRLEREQSFLSPPTDGQCYLSINTWSRNNCPGQIRPGQIRAGWDMDFQKIHPQDPCPLGWNDMGNGFCSRAHLSSNESNFYTDKMFAVEYQYQDGYTVNPRDKYAIEHLNSLDTAPAFQHRSINPYTGNYVQYFDPKTPKSSTTYGRAPTRFSYLGK